MFASNDLSAEAVAYRMRHRLGVWAPQAHDEPYCDYCEREGHTFSACPARDDEYSEYESGA